MTLPARARITTVSGRYGASLWKRWQRLIALINETVVENNALSLPVSEADQLRARRRLRSQGIDVETLADPEARESFPFPENQAKQAAFMAWLNGAIEDVVLVPTDARGSLTVPSRHHTTKYVRSAYRTGLRDAGTRLREVGREPRRGRDELDETIQLPVSQRRLATLYNRQYSQLKGITEETSRQIGEELAKGAAAGEGPPDVARRIRDRVDKIGVTRSRALARTESAHSYTEATKARYRENGITKVRVVNTTPCEEICEPIIDKNPYTLATIPDGGPPHHVNCRCALSPINPFSGR